ADLLAAEMKGSRSYSQAHVARLLEETRRHGIARATGSLVPGVNAVAAPLFDHKERIVGVIGALGRSEELDVSYESRVVSAVLRAATEIARRLGRPGAA